MCQKILLFIVVISLLAIAHLFFSINLHICMLFYLPPN